MWSFALLTLLLLLSCTKTESNSDYEIWLEGQNVTVNVSQSSENLNETVYEAERIKINKKSEELDLNFLQSAAKLKDLIADDVGLSRIYSAPFKFLPSTVKNLTIVRNPVAKIRAFAFSNLTLEHVNLSSNRIELIAHNAFNNMPDLTSVILDRNEITIYHLEFQGCPKLKLISLKCNFIKQLPEGMLQHLNNNVLSISLSYNIIKDVHKAALGIKQFQEVHLDHNELTNAQLLIKLVKADVVDLSENNITCLPKEFMENGLSKIKMLNLTGNPLECNCLQDLQRKMRKNIEFQKMSPLVQNINIILPKNNTKQC